MPQQLPMPSFNGSGGGDMDWLRNLFGGLSVGTAAGGLAGLFGVGQGKNPGDVANGYINQIPGKTQPYYQPYMDAGKGALSDLQNQYGDLTSGKTQNKLGETYHESPGYKWKLQQALAAGNNASAAGGMLGTPQHQQYSQGTAEGLANQDYNDYMNNQIGLYNTGIHGQEGINQMGYDANKGMADTWGNTLSQQGVYGYGGQNGKNESRSSALTNLFSGLGGAAGSFIPIPGIGTALGSAAGTSLAHLFGL